MLVLKENEVCPYMQNCPYNKNNTCQGARSDRHHIFTCEYVEGEIIRDGGVIRNPHDKTGKMKVILEEM